ncbi:MAG: hypothetical protein OEV42_02600 [Deltaproteobacteria bacterium]|nr:hypothetical protein [Deltaproteobacteria bacterium]
MAARAKEYIKLPGRGLKRGSIISIVGIRARLWRGKDHILSVLNFGYFEEYKRFYYKDIQAFTIRKTAVSVIWSFIFIILALFWGAIAMTLELYVSPLVWFISVIFLICLIINIIRGKSCVTSIHTAVGREELPSLGRLKKAVKVISLLEPFIEEVQGKLSSEEIRHLSQEISHEILPAPQPRSGEKPSGYRGKFHKFLFLILLIDAFLGLVSFFQNNMFVSFLSLIFFFAISVLAILSLIKQHNSALGKGVRRVTWITMAYIVVMYFASYIYNVIFIAMENPEAMNNQWKQIEIMSARSPFDDPYYMALLVTGIVSSLLLSASGLALLRSSAGEIPALSEPPPLQYEDIV